MQGEVLLLVSILCRTIMVLWNIVLPLEEGMYPSSIPFTFCEELLPIFFVHFYFLLELFGVSPILLGVLQGPILLVLMEI